jgi:sugar phosphate isomerase/epimerase
MVPTMPPTLLEHGPALVARHLTVGCSTGFMEGLRGNWPAAVEHAASLSAFAIELSALSLDELPALHEFLSARRSLPFEFTSIHAPSKRLDGIDDAQLVTALEALPPSIDAVVVHPDAIRDFDAFRRLGRLVAVENMDSRKASGRNVSELEHVFAELPEAGLCFDVAHAKDIDSTMAEAASLLDRFGSRLRHVHLSSLNAESHHVPLTVEDEQLFEPLLARCRDVPWILEAPLRDQ